MSAESKNRIGIIGGSGLYDIDGIKNIQQTSVYTPFGDPSDAFTIGELSGKQVVFLPRHGKGHKIMPSEINHQANIWAMKKLGVNWIISVSAGGSHSFAFQSASKIPPGPDRWTGFKRSSQRKDCSQLCAPAFLGALCHCRRKRRQS